MEKLNISEIFYSFQGESSLMGKPTLFIRLAGCNLDCRTCDTKYAFKTSHTKSIDEITEIAGAIKTPYLCITGGEPLMQKNVLLPLLEKLHAVFKVISIETNGTYALNDLPPYVKKIVDIKTPSSGEVGSFYPDNLNYLTTDDEIKFVISGRNDFDYSVGFISANKLWNRGINILFSPNLDIKGLAGTLSKWILESGHNIHFQPQLHKLVREEPVYLLR